MDLCWIRQNNIHGNEIYYSNSVCESPWFPWYAYFYSFYNIGYHTRAEADSVPVRTRSSVELALAPALLEEAGVVEEEVAPLP